MDVVNPNVRSRIMGSVRQRDTRPEMRLRRQLHRLGLRYRVNVRSLPGSPDLVFPKFKAVIFVHGCFWHVHGCKFSTTPSSRSAFWKKKFSDNLARDKRNIDKLSNQGWRVLVVWECALKQQDSSDEILSRRVISWLKGENARGEISG